MGQPTISQVHQDRALTDLSVAYVDNGQFLGLSMFPRVNVRHRSDKYYVWSKADFLRAQAQKRASGAEAAIIGVGLTTATYSVEREAAKYALPDPDVANADPGVDLAATAAREVMKNIMLAVEVDWASTFFATSTWTGSSTGSDITVGTVWDNSASTPIEDCRKEIRSILEKTGYKPNVMAIGKQAYDALVDHPDVLDRIKGGASSGNPAIVNEVALAGILGLDRLMVASATRNTSAEDVTASYDFIVGQNDVLICYAAPNPGLRTPSAGYTFVWNQAGGANGVDAIKRYREEGIESEMIEGGFWFDHKVVGADLGAFLSNVVT